MNASLPAGFYLCLAGAVVGGGLGLFLVFRVLGRVIGRARLSTLAAAEHGTAIVEFPFALILLLMITLWTWQLTFMCTAYQVVDYAAYAAARCAIVTIPKDWAQEKAGEIADSYSTGPTASVFDGVQGIKDAFKGYYTQNKRRDMRFSAVFVCFPISGNKKETGTKVGAGLKIDTPFFKMDLKTQATLPWPDVISNFLENQDFVTRFFYANAYTSVDVDPPDKVKYEEGDPVTVVVKHQFALRVPFAGLLFRDHGAADKGINEAGSYTEIAGRATMLVEMGEEAEPTYAEPPAGDAEGTTP